jgi:hypothetical protein
MSSAYDKFISGESFDQAILIGRPTHGDIARVITALYGVEVGGEIGWCAPYAPQTNYHLTFKGPSGRPSELQIHENSHPDSEDDPYFGLATGIAAQRDDESFKIIEALVPKFGGWTRRPDKTRSGSLDYLRATPETAEWRYHAGPDAESPALQAEIALNARFQEGDCRTLYGIMADRVLLDDVIGILTSYRDATVEGTDRLPGSGERLRAKEDQEWGDRIRNIGRRSA